MGCKVVNGIANSVTMLKGLSNYQQPADSYSIMYLKFDNGNHLGLCIIHGSVVELRD